MTHMGSHMPCFRHSSGTEDVAPVCCLNNEWARGERLAVFSKVTAMLTTWDFLFSKEQFFDKVTKKEIKKKTQPTKTSYNWGPFILVWKDQHSLEIMTWIPFLLLQYPKPDFQSWCPTAALSYTYRPHFFYGGLSIWGLKNTKRCRNAMVRKIIFEK